MTLTTYRRVIHNPDSSKEELYDALCRCFDDLWVEKVTRLANLNKLKSLIPFTSHELIETTRQTIRELERELGTKHGR